jgi:hypothetical protein
MYTDLFMAFLNVHELSKRPNVKKKLLKIMIPEKWIPFW